jgi:hypothetical protein
MSVSGRTITIGIPFSTFIVWTLATYLLEGRLLTFHHPEAVFDRFIYTIVANIIIGTIGSFILIRFLLGSAGVSNPSFFGIIGSRRLIIGLGLGIALGLAFFYTQSYPSRHPILILNAYSQVLVVSIAEVIVCWVLVGGSIANMGKSPFFIVLAIIISALLFGLYHSGHSPPFNTLKMVMILSIVGLFTGMFYFLTRSIYGTILFHNFMGMKGVTEALATSGKIENFKSVQMPVLATAVIAVGILVVLDVMLLRRR